MLNAQCKHTYTHAKITHSNRIRLCETAHTHTNRHSDSFICVYTHKKPPTMPVLTLQRKTTVHCNDISVHVACALSLSCSVSLFPISFRPRCLFISFGRSRSQCEWHTATVFLSRSYVCRAKHMIVCLCLMQYCTHIYLIVYHNVSRLLVCPCEFMS